MQKKSKSVKKVTSKKTVKKAAAAKSRAQKKPTKKAVTKKPVKKITPKRATKKKVTKKAPAKKTVKKVSGKRPAKKAATKKKVTKKAPARKKRGVSKKTISAQAINLKEQIEKNTKPFIAESHFEPEQANEDLLEVVAPVIQEEMSDEEIEGKDLAYSHKKFILHASVGMLMVAVLFFWVRTIRAHIGSIPEQAPSIDPYVANIKESLDSIDALTENEKEATSISDIVESSVEDVVTDAAQESYKDEITTEFIKQLEEQTSSESEESDDPNLSQ